jgi:hypothetical protein
MPGLSDATGPFGSLKQRISHRILHYLASSTTGYEPFAAPHPKLLLNYLRPGDVLLIEGNTRLSAIIKYLTQSTWSHASLYIGPDPSKERVGLDDRVLLEAEAEKGVHLTPISAYAKFNTRICRPSGLSDADRQKVVDFALKNLGKQYDSHHIVDLLRYLFPYPPVPVALRRRLLAIGAGDPTRAICSTLIAQAFYSVNYPILPAPEDTEVQQGGVAEAEDGEVEVSPFTSREIFHIKKTGLFTPRDFDVSPYFGIVKPLVESHFDYHKLIWSKD